MNIQHSLEEVISLDGWMSSKGYAYAKDSGNMSKITGTTWPPNRSTAGSEAAPGNQPTHQVCLKIRHKFAGSLSHSQ